MFCHQLDSNIQLITENDQGDALLLEARSSTDSALLISWLHATDLDSVDVNYSFPALEQLIARFPVSFSPVFSQPVESVDFDASLDEIEIIQLPVIEDDHLNTPTIVSDAADVAETLSLKNEFSEPIVSQNTVLSQSVVSPMSISTFVDKCVITTDPCVPASIPRKKTDMPAAATSVGFILPNLSLTAGFGEISGNMNTRGMDICIYLYCVIHFFINTCVIIIFIRVLFLEFVFQVCLSALYQIIFVSFCCIVFIFTFTFV